MGGKYALALCGGGGKGSYQLGVWKALEKFDLLKDITVVSGTSVGALNAVLFSIGDYELAKGIWYKIKPNDLLHKKDIKSEKEIFGFCSRLGLRKIIESVPMDKMRLPVYVNTFDLSTHTTKSVLLNEHSKGEITEYLLASSAMPFIYPPVRINGQKNIDGGLTKLGNVPIEKLYEEGERNIIISALDSNFSMNMLCDNVIGNVINIPGIKIDIQKRFPGLRYMELKPSYYMGFLKNGTLDFSQQGILNRIASGFTDTKNFLERVREEQYNVSSPGFIRIPDNRSEKNNEVNFMQNMQKMLEEIIEMSKKLLFPVNPLMLSNDAENIFKVYKNLYNGNQADFLNLMKRDTSAINKNIADRMKILFKSESDLMDFISKVNPGLPNVNMKTMDKEVFWGSPIFELNGWKFQQHKLFNNYRLINKDKVRQAWYLMPDHVINDLERYEALNII